MSSNSDARLGVANLRLAFSGQKKMFFKDLTFHYKKGEKVLLLGPSGSGKSTLLQVLSGLVPDKVELPVSMDWREVPESWGFIFQDPETQFCMPYVDEEIAFVLENRNVPREKMPELIRHYLSLVGLAFDEPHRLIRTLSGGMKQRLAIAGVLALEPQVLFLDEPTALLDPQGTQQLWEVVRRIGKGRTVLIVEHKIDHVLDFVDRLVLFDSGGQIVADGPKQDVMRSYREAMDRDGIWHPGVWQKFIETRTPEAAAPSNPEPLLELDQFHVYRNREIKFSVDHLVIGTGEWIAIIGENGAGKSTMIEGIVGLIRSRGRVRWHLANPEDEVAFVFQNPEYQFVTDRVDDEMGFALKLRGEENRERRTRTDEWLERYRLARQRGQHPFQLSVGQKKRLSVASMLITEPKAVILDEPTFGQDARNTFALIDLFRAMRQSGTTVITVTHEAAIFKHFATRVLRVKKGRIVYDSKDTLHRSDEEGTVDDASRSHGQMVF